MDAFYALPEEYYLYDDLIEVDNLYAAATTDVEHYHVLPDGTAITISGPYQHVMSVKQSLDSFPPSLSPYSAAATTVPLTAPSQTSQITTFAHGSRQRVTQNGVTFSGSGVMIFGASSATPTNWHLVFFCGQDPGYSYQECGQCDGDFGINERIDANFLFAHAQTVCRDQSIGLFNIASSLTNATRYLDIVLGDGTTYRVHFYWIEMPDITVLPTLFGQNKVALARHPPTFVPVRGAGADLKLFDKDVLARSLRSHNPTSSFMTQDSDGTAQYIHGRTLIVLQTLLVGGVLDAFAHSSVRQVTNTPTPIPGGGGASYNVINVPT